MIAIHQILIVPVASFVWIDLHKWKVWREIVFLNMQNKFDEILIYLAVRDNTLP